MSGRQAPPDARLARGAEALGVPLDATQLAQLRQLGSELLRWNQAYNLTAITDPEEVLTHHLLDSLSAQPRLAGTSIADAGTGAGFPGLPLAIADPRRQFTLIDSVDKKLRFIDHVAGTLGLANVRTLHARVEAMPPQAFDTVIARAFAPLPRMVALVAPLCAAHTMLLAMVGRWPPPGGAADATPPPPWRIETAIAVQVPGLDEARHLLTLRRAG